MLTASELHQLAVVSRHPEEGGVVGDAARLGEVVRNDDHRVSAAKAPYQLFHHPGRKN